MKIMNDRMSDDAFVEFLTKAFRCAKDVMRQGAGFYIWTASVEQFEAMAAVRQAEMQIRQVLIWNKSVFTLGRQDYQWKHEPCLYGWKEGAAHYFIDDRRKATVIQQEQPDMKTITGEKAIAMLKQILAEGLQESVLDEKKPSRNAEHPTMKPVALMERLIKNSTRKGDIVLDLFGGSGSTLIAAERTGRKCRIMELDPFYADVIIHRWEQETGRKAEKINGTENAE